MCYLRAEPVKKDVVDNGEAAFAGGSGDAAEAAVWVHAVGDTINGYNLKARPSANGRGPCC